MTVSKVGVLTFHRCINYGSYWQARSLVDGLRARGFDAVLLDYTSRKANLSEWKCGFKPTLPTPVSRADQAVYRRKIRKFFDCFEQLPLSPRFCLEAGGELTHYDIVVVGSDEVWNLSHPWYGRHDIFYGNGLNTDRLVSYAASFGSYSSSQSLGRPWAEWLRNFAAISVRDGNSQAIIRDALGFEPDLVLDPCLQFSVEPGPHSPYMPEPPFAAVYGHNFSTSFIERARGWAKRRNLRLISIGYRNEWADEQWIDADPHDFAHFVAAAAAVITNFFHGCVFALRNEKPFVCETSEYRANKLNGLMTKIGGQGHLVDESSSQSTFSQTLDQPLAGEMLLRLAELRNHSGSYLDNALSC